MSAKVSQNPNKTVLDLSRDTSDSLIGAVRKAIGDVLLALDFKDPVYKVVIRVYKHPAVENSSSGSSAVTEESFVMFGAHFCKLQLGGIDGKGAVAIANELNAQKIRGVEISAEGPKLMVEKLVITEEQLLERAAKRSHEIRRRTRAMERLKNRMTDVPAPGGMAIFSQYRPLTTDIAASSAESCGVVEWSTVPQALDPAYNFVENTPLGEDSVNEARVAAAGLAAEHQTGSSAVPIGRGSARYSGVPAAATSNTSADYGTTTRAFRKRRQAESFVLALRGLLPTDSATSLHIVDFGSGSGNLCLPLAFLFPQHRFTAVDMKAHSVDLLLQRAQAAGLSNIRGICGTIEQFAEHFDVSLALHACGQATDFALWQAERCRAAYIVCPCCVGKLKHRRSAAAAESRSFVDSGSGNDSGNGAICVPCISHPRSEWLYQALGGGAQELVATRGSNGTPGVTSATVAAEEWFGLMAKTGDISHGQAHIEGNFCAENETVARMCKCHLEVDRNCRMQEVGYRTVLSQLLQAELTSKGDLLAGVPQEGLNSGRFRWPWPLDAPISVRTSSASTATDSCSELAEQ